MIESEANISFICCSGDENILNKFIITENHSNEKSLVRETCYRPVPDHKGYNRRYDKGRKKHRLHFRVVLRLEIVLYHIPCSDTKSEGAAVRLGEMVSHSE